MRETQGERVSALVLFEQTVDMSAVANVDAAQLQETTHWTACEQFGKCRYATPASQSHATSDQQCLC